MKTKLYFKALKILTLSVCLITGLNSCKKLVTKQSNDSEEYVAHFHCFKYEGKDDFYNENPLSDNDAYYNPILPGWYSDPSICSNGEDYFLVTSTFVYFPGVPIFHSRDLINWKQIGYILDRPDQLKLEGQSTSQGIFAPAISYNPYNKTFYMITTNIGGGNFFVKTQDPFGSWSDPVWLPEVHGIDPSFFFDDDGKAYILNNDEPEGGSTYDGHRAIRIREFDVENEKVIGPEKVLVDGGVRPEEKPIWIEGPHMYKINSQYYLMAAEGGTGPGHSEVILRGNQPMGEFIPYKHNPILTQRHLNLGRPDPITCVGHADLIQTKNGDWWSVFLGCRPINGKFENLGRETFLMPVEWSEDGFPYMTKGEELVPLVLRKNGTIRGDDVTFGNFTKTDEFDSASLGLEWMTLRSPAKNLYSLTQKSGCLSLKYNEINATQKKTSSFVCRRLQHHKFDCTTKLELETSNEADMAGFLLYKDETHQYFLAVNKADKELKISLIKVSENNNEVLAETHIKNKKNRVTLKVNSTGTHFNFYYAIENNNWILLAENIDAHYLSTANSFGFTGTTIGLYTTRKTN